MSTPAPNALACGSCGARLRVSGGAGTWWVVGIVIGLVIGGIVFMLLEASVLERIAVIVGILVIVELVASLLIVNLRCVSAQQDK